MSLVLDGTNGLTGNSGTLLSNSTIGVGAATPAASGAGISFPATQSASTDVNTLDDYEEGTWTPTFTGSSSNPTVTYETTWTKGSYTKVGNTVTIVAEIRTTAYSGGSGDLRISNLPFTSNSSNFFNCAVFLYNVTFNASYIYLLEIPPSATYGYIVECVSAAASNVWATSKWSNTNPSILRFILNYLV